MRQTRNLTGPALDWAVAKCETRMWLAYDNALNNETPLPARPSEYLRDNNFGPDFSPSTSWDQGGPIIERESICLDKGHDGIWLACTKQNYDDAPEYMQGGETALIAAMRCYVASKLGYQIEIPEELQ